MPFSRAGAEREGGGGDPTHRWILYSKTKHFVIAHVSQSDSEKGHHLFSIVLESQIEMADYLFKIHDLFHCALHHFCHLMWEKKKKTKQRKHYNPVCEASLSSVYHKQSFVSFSSLVSPHPQTHACTHTHSKHFTSSYYSYHPFSSSSSSDWVFSELHCKHHMLYDVLQTLAAPFTGSSLQPQRFLWQRNTIQNCLLIQRIVPFSFQTFPCLSLVKAASYMW